MTKSLSASTTMLAEALMETVQAERAAVLREIRVELRKEIAKEMRSFEKSILRKIEELSKETETDKDK